MLQTRADEPDGANAHVVEPPAWIEQAFVHSTAAQLPYEDPATPKIIRTVKLRRKKKPPAPDMAAEIDALMAKGELKLQPYQERIAKALDRGDGIEMKSRGRAPNAARRQLLAYAKTRAVPNCGPCKGGGIIQQQQIDDAPIERLCECLLETK